MPLPCHPKRYPCLVNPRPFCDSSPEINKERRVSLVPLGTASLVSKRYSHERLSLTWPGCICLFSQGQVKSLLLALPCYFLDVLSPGLYLTAGLKANPSPTFYVSRGV